MSKKIQFNAVHFGSLVFSLIHLSPYQAQSPLLDLHGGRKDEPGNSSEDPHLQGFWLCGLYTHSAQLCCCRQKATHISRCLCFSKTLFTQQAVSWRLTSVLNAYDSAEDWLMLILWWNKTTRGICRTLNLIGGKKIPGITWKIFKSKDAWVSSLGPGI